MRWLTPLDPETIATIRAHYADLELTWVDDDMACATTIAELCDSHEALRAQRDEARADFHREFALRMFT